MTNVDVVENRVSAVQKYLNILRDYKKYSQKEIEDSIDLRGATERYLYLVCQSAIDLAEAYIGYKKLRKPATLGESFEILCENDIIDDDLKNKMIQMTGFRNLITHDYGKIDYNIVYNVLHEGAKDIQNFIKIIAKAY